MKTHAAKTNEKQPIQQRHKYNGPGSHATATIEDNRPRTVYQRQLLKTMDAHAAAKAVPIQRMTSPEPSRRDNKTGLPDPLKSGIENLSGYAMDDVNVHRNSNKPAQLQAHAYAQGTDIHLGPGQEKHLPHEAWHVVQQKQGRVKPTMQFKSGLNINDDAGLEGEADVMGTKALQLRTANSADLANAQVNSDTIQRKIGFEFQAYDSVTFEDRPDIKTPFKGTGKDFYLEPDHGKRNYELEIVTDPVEETGEGRVKLEGIMDSITRLVNKIYNFQKVKDLSNDISWNVDMGNCEFYVPGKVHFHPQATVGIKFEKIADLVEAFTSAPYKTGTPFFFSKFMPAFNHKKDEKGKLASEVGWSGKKDQQEFKKIWTRGLNQAQTHFVNGSEKVKSFATILFSLAEMAASNHLKLEDGRFFKYYMPFHFRFGLKPFYDQLAPKEKDHLNKKLPEEVKKSKPFDKYKGDLQTNISDYPKFDTIEGLLKLLEEGENPLKPYNYSEKNPDSLGLTKPTDIGKSDSEKSSDRDGTLIELRKLRNDVPPKQLTPFALAVFDMVRIIHSNNH